MKTTRSTPYALCLKNTNAEDLVLRKLYQVIPDPRAEKESHIRVIDESGEDYLYPASYFFVLELPQKVERALRRTLPAAT
jgi:hypothetical protein